MKEIKTKKEPKLQIKEEKTGERKK